MKSIIKVKFLGLDYYTVKKITVIKQLTAKGQIFIDSYTEPIVINEGNSILPSFKISAKEKADAWVENNTNILHEIMHNPQKELYSILNWEILSIQNFDDKNANADPVNNQIFHFNKKESILNAKKPLNEKAVDMLERIMKENNNALDEKMKNDFIHTFHKMKDSIKGLSLYQKIRIVLNAMGVGYQASATAYDRINQLLKFDDISSSSKKIN